MLKYPQVALDFMNRDHAEFVSLCEKLLALLTHQHENDQIDTLMAELLEHTRHHFVEEERQMLAAHFPPYPMHKDEHDRVLGDLTRQVVQWQQGRDVANLRDFMQGPVADWFVTHVGMMDSVTARFIENNRSKT